MELMSFQDTNKEVRSSEVGKNIFLAFKDCLSVPVLIAAVLFALLHIAPHLYAYSQLPEGWSYTWNLSGSPDMMQYRIFTYRSQEIGPIVDNAMTTEPTRPHIPVVFYYVVGKLAQWTSASPEFVKVILGSMFAFVLSLMVFGTVKHFLGSRYQTWWVFLVLMLGGGFGAHFMLLRHFDVIAENFLIKRLIIEGLENAIVFEQYRNHYIFTTLFDTHFLFFLIVALFAIYSFYLTIRVFSLFRMFCTGVFFGIATLLHIYEGITLLAIVTSVTFIFWRKGLPTRFALFTSGACAIFVGVVIGWQISLYHSGGVSLPPWRAPAIYFSELALAYPIAWLLIAFGIGDYWRRSGIKECFLMGWALGCTMLTLSGPFYPYPDRGTITLQIPIYIMAGAIFFSNRSFVNFRMATLAVIILAATPSWALVKEFQVSNFERHLLEVPRPWAFMNTDRLKMVELIRKVGQEDDVLIVDKRPPPWKTDDLWLAPGFRGKLYCGHYFLTLDYDRKREELKEFYSGENPIQQQQFLYKAGIRFVFVDSKKNPSKFEQIAGLTVLMSAEFGTLFEFRADE